MKEHSQEDQGERPPLTVSDSMSEPRKRKADCCNDHPPQANLCDHMGQHDEETDPRDDHQ